MSQPEQWPPIPVPAAPPALPPINALTGNRAVLVLLVIQNVVGGLLPLLHVAVWLSLLASFAVTALAFGLFFRPQLAALVSSERWRRPPAVLVALGALVLALIASQGVVLFLRAVWPQSFLSVPSFGGTGVEVWPLLLGAGLVIPLAEETVFRGMLLPGYERVRTPLVAGLYGALVFAGAHGLPAQALGVLPLAWVLIRAVQHSRSFWTGYLIHAGNNLLAVALASVVLGNKTLDALAGSSGQVSLGIGFAGLLVSALALWGATVWLRPKLPAEPAQSGPVWSGSLIVILVLVVLATVSTLLTPLLERLQNFNLN